MGLANVLARRAYNRAWQKANPDKVRAYSRAWQTANSAKRRVYLRNHKYGTTSAQLEAIWLRQGMACAICRTQVSGKRAWHVDHDHKKRNIIRGLLCGRCNVGLGYFLDNPQSLEAAAKYLRLAES